MTVRPRATTKLSRVADLQAVISKSFGFHNSKTLETVVAHDLPAQLALAVLNQADIPAGGKDTS